MRLAVQTLTDVLLALIGIPDFMGARVLIDVASKFGSWIGPDGP